MKSTGRWALTAWLLVTAAACGDEPIDPSQVRYTLPDDAYWPDSRGYPGVGAGRLVITNNFDDTISILDLALVGTDDLAVMATVPVGLIPAEREGPHHVAADPSGEFYYIGISNFVPGSGSGPHGVHGTGTTDGHALKIRAADNLEVASVRVDHNPGDIRLTPDGEILLQSHFDIGRISEVVLYGGEPEEMDSDLILIDPGSMTRLAAVPTCPAAHGIAVSPDSQTAYLSCLDDAMVVVDLADPEHPTTKIAVRPDPGDVINPLCLPYAMTISPSGDSVWVSCLTSGEVRRFDTATAAMDPTRIATLAGPAVFGTFTADGSTLVVPHQAPDGVSFIEADTAEVVEDVALTPDVCINAHVVRFTDGDAQLLLVCEGNHSDPGTLVVLDPQSHLVEHVVTLGRYPDDIAILRGNP